jgi:Kelch motif
MRLWRCWLALAWLGGLVPVSLTFAAVAALAPVDLGARGAASRDPAVFTRETQRRAAQLGALRGTSSDTLGRELVTHADEWSLLRHANALAKKRVLLVAAAHDAGAKRSRSRRGDRWQALRIYLYPGQDRERNRSLSAPVRPRHQYLGQARRPATRGSVSCRRGDRRKALSGGGYASGLLPSATLDVYNPATNTWASKKPIPTARGHAAGRALNGMLYVVGGTASAAGIPLGRVDRYEPASDTWAARANMPTPRMHLAAAVANGILYAVGGAGTFVADTFAVNEAYTP